MYVSITKPGKLESAKLMVLLKMSRNYIVFRHKKIPARNCRNFLFLLYTRYKVIHLRVMEEVL